MKQRLKIVPQLSLLPIVIGIFLTPSATYASDSYAGGCKSYSAGNFGTAKAQFLSALKTDPSFRPHYQLGNTYLQLADHVNARKAYEKCLALNPPADVKTNCVKAISYLTTGYLNPPIKHASPAVQMYAGSSIKGSQTASGKTETGNRTTAAASSVVDARAQELETRKARILADAQVETEKIKQVTKQQLEEANAASNRWWRDREGRIFTGCSQDEEQEIRREGESKANKVLEAAHRRVKDLTY